MDDVLRDDRRPARVEDHRPGRLTRRGLLAAGTAGAAALWLAPIGGIAEAATLRPELKRATWTALADPLVTADVDGRRGVLRLVEVADLPVADIVPALRGHDAAFALRFTGPAGLEQRTYALSHAELGGFELFLVPVGLEGSARRYEAIVDRTVRVAGVNEEGGPERVRVPDDRAALPDPDAPVAPMVSASGVRVAGSGAVTTAGRRPRVRRLAVRRASDGRSALAELALANAGTVRTVDALLLRRGRVVARGALVVRGGRPLRVRLAGRRAPARGRHELLLTLVDAGGRVTRVRRRVRVA